MMSEWWRDDDQLLAALGRALREAEPVPRRIVEAGKAAYLWRDIDAELAALTYDSSHERAPGYALTRTESASLLALTFTASELTIELEINGDTLIGQIVPPQPGLVETRTAAGLIGTTPIDDVGCFLIRPVPAAPFRLCCRTRSGHSALTNWITV